MIGALRTRLIATAAELHGLEGSWWDLWRASRAATPFQSPAWLLPWWDTFAPGDLASVAVEATGGRLLALLPAYLETGAMGRRLLPLGIGISDHLDILADPAAGPEPVRALVDAVSADPRWDRWELEEMAPDAAGLALPCPSGCSQESGPQSACPVVDLSVAIPSSRRRKLAMSRNRVQRRGGEIVPVGPGDTAAFLADLVRLHGARWASRGEGGVIPPQVEAFHALALPRLAAADLCRLSVLRFEGAVAGAQYALRHRGRAYAYLGGFDPAFEFESPGTALLGDLLERAREEGAAELHLLRGQEAYKYGWGAKDRWNTRRSFARGKARPDG